jgi:hypothetical protein
MLNKKIYLLASFPTGLKCCVPKQEQRAQILHAEMP